jgi:hypothetical protein
LSGGRLPSIPKCDIAFEGLYNEGEINTEKRR